MPDETRFVGPSAKPTGDGSDLVAGLVLLAFCTVTYLLTTGFAEVPEILSQNVPPTFFPRLILFAMALLSVSLLVQGWREWRERPGHESELAPKTPGPTGLPFVKPVWVTGLLYATAIFLVPRLGMLTTIFLLSIAFPFYWGERSKRRIGFLALGLPSAIYLIFDVALGMRFPEAWLW